MDYLHLNPVQAGLVKEGQGFDACEWTSLREYRKPPSKRFAWMETADAFAETGTRDTPAGRRAFIERLETITDWSRPTEAGRVLREGQSLQSTLQRGWYFGVQDFRDKLLAGMRKPEVEKERRTRLMSERGRFQFDYDERLAGQIVAHGLGVLGLAEADLAALRKNGWRKALIAHVLTERTSIRQGLDRRTFEYGHQALREQAGKRDGGPNSNRPKTEKAEGENCKNNCLTPISRVEDETDGIRVSD